MTELEEVKEVIKYNKKLAKNRLDNINTLQNLETQIAIAAKTLWEIQTTRVGIGHRAGKLQKSEIPISTEELEISQTLIESVEGYHKYHLRKMLEMHPLSPWVEEQRGLGLDGFARLLGAIKSISRFPNVAKLWKYCGMHTVDGNAPKMKAGEKIDWSPEARTILYMLGEAFIKVEGSPYRDYYLSSKTMYLSRQRVGPSECPFGQHHQSKGRTYPCINDEGGSKHVHNAARRYAVKMMLRDVWVQWHKVCGPKEYTWVNVFKSPTKNDQSSMIST